MDKRKQIEEILFHDYGRIDKITVDKLCALLDVVGQSEQCCSNPKHKTEVNEMFENWVECKNCGKEII